MENELFKNDDLTRKIVRKAGLEQPSYSFTSRIMEQVRLSHASETFIYKPVIKSKTWILISLSVISVMLLIIYAPALQQPGSTQLDKYLSPAQDVLGNATTAVVEKLSFLRSLSWMAVALTAGWLLLVMDKIFRKLKTSG